MLTGRFLQTRAAPGGIVLTSKDQLLVRRRYLDKDEDITALDALCCAPFPHTDDKLWISTPNMWFVPEPPYVTRSDPLAYFDDGMLGRHEYYKWPQAFNRQELHSMAAPANSALFSLDRELEKYGDGSHLQRPTDSAIQSRFSDVAIAWDDLKANQDFFTSRGTNRVMLSDHMASRLRDAMKEVSQQATALAEYIVHEGDSDVDMEQTPQYIKALRTHGYLFQRSRLSQLQRCHYRLTYLPEVPSDLLLWFREFQRLLLDVRAWILWMSVVRPRLLDPDFCKPFPVLPIRGVFTSDLTHAADLFRVGVPVWLIRELDTFTTSTWINRVKTVIRPTISFSNVRHPEMLDFTTGPRIDSLSVDEIRAAMRKFSLLQHPMIRSSKEYDPALASKADSTGVNLLTQESATSSNYEASSSTFYDGKSNGSETTYRWC